MCREEYYEKRFTALMTTLILSVIFSISASAYDVEADVIPKKNFAIVTSGDKEYSGDITIPSSIKVNESEYTVREIKKDNFHSWHPPHCLFVCSLDEVVILD